MLPGIWGVLFVGGGFRSAVLQKRRLRTGCQRFQLIRWLSRIVAAARGVGRTDAYSAALCGVEVLGLAPTQLTQLRA